MAVKTVQVVLAGQTYNATLNSITGKYEATITAPAISSYKQSGHYYNVQLKATDDAGNITTKDSADTTLGNSLRLTVKEKVAPVISITSPTASALITNNKPTVSFTITDNDSGVNPESISLSIDSGIAITSGITKTVLGDGYSCNYVLTEVLTDGSHTIKINGSDNDGNAAAQKTVTFKIDTAPPTLSITAPVNNLITNKAACTVTGTTNDTTSSPCTVSIKLNAGAAETVAVNPDGSFLKSITLASGTNTITIVSKDGANTPTTVTRTVVLDTMAPVIGALTMTPNPVDAGATFIIAIEVSD